MTTARVDSTPPTGRLPRPLPQELDVDAQQVYASLTGGPRGSDPAFAMTDEHGRLEGPFNAMVIAPQVGGPLQALGASIRYMSNLPDRAREIAVLTVAVARRCDFEWYAHAAVGSRAGLTADELTSLRALGPAPTFDRLESVVHRTVIDLLAAHDLADDRYAEAAELLGAAGVVELVVLCGYYELLATTLQVFRVPLPSDAHGLGGEPV